MDITRYMDLSFKAIPKSSPIPPNSFALLRGQYILQDLESGTQFVIWKNKEEIVIKGPPLKGVPGIEDMALYDMAEILNKEFAEWVTIIEDLAPTVEFGITNYAQLVPDPYSEGYQIVLDYEKELRRVSCPIWAPIIPINEVEFTVWGAGSDRRGIWNGNEVDVFYANDDLNMWRLNRSMYGLRLIDGLDFTFELYGHLADKDGRIVGLVSEAAHGRLITASDQDFVASELQRLESFGCIFGGVWANQMLISNGKLRLLQCLLIKHYSDPEELRREAAETHAEALDTLCQEMKDFGAIGWYRFPPDFLTDPPELVSYLRHSIPRTPSVSGMVFVREISRPGYRAVIKYGDSCDNEDDDPRRITSLRTRTPQREYRRVLFGNSRHNRGSFRNEDAPLSADSRLRHPVFITIRPPSGRSRSRRAAETWYDSDSTESKIETIW